MNVDLDLLLSLDLNCDFSRPGDILLQIDITKDSDMLIPQLYELIPVSYVIIKLCGVTAYKTPNLQGNSGNLITNAILLPITTISDGITTLTEGNHFKC